MLIENIEEELDPVLDPVLERRYVKKGRGFTVALADKEVWQCFLHDNCTRKIDCGVALMAGCLQVTFCYWAITCIDTLLDALLQLNPTADSASAG